MRRIVPTGSRDHQQNGLTSCIQEHADHRRFDYPERDSGYQDILKYFRVQDYPEIEISVQDNPEIDFALRYNGKTVHLNGQEVRRNVKLFFSIRFRHDIVFSFQLITQRIVGIDQTQCMLLLDTCF